MQTVVETQRFAKQAERLFSEEQRADIINLLAVNPLIGDEIQGTGGVRKVRVPASGRGKRGGARVIYYFYNDSMPVFALFVYAKNEKTDITADEAKVLERFVRELKDAYRRS